jgi:hypothetical protein
MVLLSSHASQAAVVFTKKWMRGTPDQEVALMKPMLAPSKRGKSGKRPRKSNLG